MSFVMGSSCFLQSPLHRSPFSYSSSSVPSSSPQSSSVILCSFKRNSEKKRQSKSVVVSLIRENGDSGNFCKRRAFLFLGISVLPFLRLRARALEEDHDGTIQGENQQKEQQMLQTDGTRNPFLSLLNGLGIFSSGILGALYALSQSDKKAAEATIESVKCKLKEKEAALVSIGKDYEMKLLNEQEERIKQLRKAKEEQQSLTNQLQSANNTIAGLGKELQKEKRLIEELKLQIDSLQNGLLKSVEDKKELEQKLKEKVDSVEASQKRIALLSSEIKDKEVTIENLSSLLSGKDLELRNLTVKYKKTEEELAEAKSEIERLKDELLKSEKEVQLKNSAVDSLNESVSSLIIERDNNRKRVDALEKEYSDLKASSGKKAALDAKLLRESKQEHELFKEKLQNALNEATVSREIIADLTRERDDLRKTLDMELKNLTNLKHELRNSKEVLVTSKNEAFELEKELKQSKKLCTELETQVFMVQSEFSEVQESLRQALDDSKASNQTLTGELMSAKELLKKTKDELQVVSHELAAAMENRNSLQKELLDVLKKVEDISCDLREERKVVASLNKELQQLEKQNLTDKEGRQTLEKDLEEATQSLDEMNRNTLLLSGELKVANSRISDLEEEKDAIQKTLADQKNFTQDAQENLEDAHNLVMRLGKERESLEKRSKKLEEELLIAKGEILRLRSRVNSETPLVNDQLHQQKGSQVNSSKTPRVNDQLHQKNGETEGNAAIYAKKSGRRRKNSTQ